MKALGRLVRGRGENIVLGALLLAGVFIASQPIADSTRHFHNLIASANGAFLNLFDWAFDLAHLARENVDLREQVSVLSLRVSELEDVEQQNARLRALQDFEARSELTILTGAEVIGWGDGRSSLSLTISAGRLDGVERYQAVVTSAGLVGRIDRTPGASTSIVSLLSDPANSVAVSVERSREQGIFRYISGIASLEGVRQSADVLVGDRVISSGMGGVYPAGLLIGTVSAVADEADGLTMKVVITPAATLDRLEEVFVLRR
jgi:rod shape-determining protein MreC